ncbi:MAG: glycosyl hydrolase [Gemmataceae bacterium]
MSNPYRAPAPSRTLRRFLRPAPLGLLALEDRLAPSGVTVTGSAAGSPPVVNVYETDTGALVRSIRPFADSFGGGVNVATADVTGDGVADVIAAAGPGGGPHVRAFDGVSGAPLAGPLGGFFAFDPGFRGGVAVAAGDIDGDGHAEVIVAAGPGGGPHVRAYSGLTGGEVRSFFAYSPEFRGGVELASGDLDDDGRDDIVTAAGPGGGPHVQVFDGATNAVRRSFFAFDPAFTGGVRVAVGNTDGAVDDLLVGAGPGGGPHVRAFGPAGEELASFLAFDPAYRGGVRLLAHDSEQSSVTQEFVVTGGGRMAGGTLRQLTAGAVLRPTLTPLAAALQTGVPAAASQDTVLFRRAGLGSYFEGQAADLPRTNQKPPPNTGYEVPNTPTPNVTQGFLDRGLPVQTSDWWSPVTNRSVNHPGPTGWGGDSNNNPTALVADPVVYGLRPNHANDTTQVQFGLGQNVNPRAAVESHYQLGNFPPSETGLVNNATRVYYRYSPFESNGLLDVQVGVFDPAVPAGPDNTGDGSNAPAQRAVSAANVAVDDYSDWGATFAWTDPKGAFGMTATGMVGSPYTYFTTTGGKSVELYFGRVVQSVRTDRPVTAKDNTLPTRVLDAGAGDEVLVVAVPQLDGQRFAGSTAYYAFFGPAGTKWNLTERTTVDGSLTYKAKAEIDLQGKDYFSSAALPASIVRADGSIDTALLEVYRSHAYAFPTAPPVDPAKGRVGSTEVAPTFDPATGLLATDYRVYTALKEAGTAAKPNHNGTLFTLYPHQYKNLNAATTQALAVSPAASYVSPKGELKLLVPTPTAAGDALNVSTFTTTLTYRGGVLPALPNGVTDPADNAILLKYLARVAATPYDQLPIDPTTKASGAGNFLSQDGAYDAGKRAVRVANLLPLFDTATPTAEYPRAKITDMRNTLLGQVKRHLADWFDATDYKFFLLDTVWDTVLPYPDDGFLAIQKNNDHHFHFGYFLKAAAIVARYDPGFVSDAQFGPLLTLLAKDVANTDRTDTRFPFLRNFQPYLGHSYADGTAGDDQGNNQESSSEAMNFASGLILLGEAMMAVDATAARQLRDAGVYLYTTEEASVGQYWFDVDGDTFPADFTDSYDATTLTAQVEATQTTINVQATSTKSTGMPIRLPAVTPFTVQIDRELLLVTGSAPGPQLTLSNGGTIATTDWTVVRGVMGTESAVHWLEDTFYDPFPATALSAAVAAADTAIPVVTANAFPTANGFLAKVGSEVVKVTGGAGTTTWTVERGQQGTTADGHLVGETVQLVSPPNNNFTVLPWTKKVSVKSAPYRSTALTTSVDPAATQVTVASADRFPDTNGFLVSVGSEVVEVTAGAGTPTWTIARGREGTTAVAHGAGDPVRLVSPTKVVAATIIQGGALNRSNFFAGDSVDEPATNFAISWLPVNASSLYLGRYRTADGRLYAREAFRSMLNMEAFLFSDEPVYAAAPYKYVVNGTLKGTPGQGGEYPGSIWAYQAFSDPAGALAALDKYVLTPATPDLMRTQGSPGGFDGLDQGESVAFTFSFAHALARLGEVDPDGYAVSSDGSGSVGTYAVFRDPASGARTYVAYNPHPTAARRLTFQSGDGTTATVDVPALSMVTQIGTDAGTRKVVLGPPAGLPSTAIPANRLFLRGEYRASDGQLATSLSPQPGSDALAVVLPVAGTDEVGNPRGPDFFPAPNGFQSPLQFEVAGLSGTPDPNAGADGGPRTAFSLPLLNNLFRNPVDQTKGVQFNENSALVVLNVAYFANATVAKPSRVEVWSLGPQTYDGNGTIQPGFNDGRATWQPYVSETWFGRAAGDEKNWFVGDYPTLANGRVRVSVWTTIPNVKQDGSADLPQSQIGLRTNAAANQGAQAFVDIPYSGVTVAG